MRGMFLVTAAKHDVIPMGQRPANQTPAARKTRNRRWRLRRG